MEKESSKIKRVGYANVMGMLKKDHLEIHELFQVYKKTAENAFQTRSDVFAEMKQELERNMLLEEEIFYPAVKEASQESEVYVLVQHMLKEHDEIKELLRELVTLEPVEKEFDKKLRVLMGKVLDHIEGEEKELFLQARRVLAPEKVRELALQIEKRKKEIIQWYVHPSEEKIGISA